MSENPKPFVVAGGIVRNRAWVLPRYLDALLSNKPDAIFMLTDNNEDATAEILTARPGVSVLNLEIEPQAGCTRDGSDGNPRYSSAFMAKVRNSWAEQALRCFPACTHLWVVDSDVLPEPDVLERLLALEAPVAAAFVPIGDGRTPIAMIGWDATKGQARRTGEEKLLTQPHVATLVGGCYLIAVDLWGVPTDILNFGTGEKTRIWRRPWGEHPQGEDGHFALFVRCNSVAPMLHDPGARCRHLMERDSIPVACSDCGAPLAFHPEEHRQGGILVCVECARKREADR